MLAPALRDRIRRFLRSRGRWHATPPATESSSALREATAANPVETLWRDPDFLKLWIGQMISLVGSRFTGLAIQIIAVVTLAATPAHIGILAAVNSAPLLLVSPFAGVWADRHRRRPVLVAADVGRAFLLATIPVAALGGWLSMDQIYIVGFLTGVLGTFFDVAYQAYLPTLDAPSQLVEANSKLAASRSTANVAGLSAAGVVIQAISAPLAVALDALSYLASALYPVRTWPPDCQRPANRSVARASARLMLA